MAKHQSKKKDKDLRREIEILKAQLTVNYDYSKSKEVKNEVLTSGKSNVVIHAAKLETIDDRAIKKDLLKTVVLSAVAFATILTLWSFDITGFRF